MLPDPKDLRALARRDPALGRALRRVPAFPGFPVKRGPAAAPSHFHHLARVIVYQQLAGKAASTIHGRVAALTPGRGFPDARAFLELEDAELRGAGLSRSKLRALRDLAERVVDGRLPLARIARLDDDEVLARVTEVFGIGEWSAQMFLIFRLGRLDVLPTGDLGVQEGLLLLDGLDERPTPAELAARGEAWGPLRSVATWVLYRLVDEARST